MASRLFLVVSILIFSLYFAHPAFAHGEARLEVSSDRLSPGAPLTIRGVDFTYEQELALTLIGPGIELSIGTVITDVEGAFTHTLTLPVDLQEGAYNVRALAHELEVISPVITVQGAPVIANEEGEGQREEEDGLLAPMPTFVPGVEPGVAAKSTQAVDSVIERSGTNPSAIVILVIILVAGGAIFVQRQRKR